MQINFSVYEDRVSRKAPVELWSEGASSWGGCGGRPSVKKKPPVELFLTLGPPTVYFNLPSPAIT